MALNARSVTRAKILNRPRLGLNAYCGKAYDERHHTATALSLLQTKWKHIPRALARAAKQALCGVCLTACHLCRVSLSICSGSRRILKERLLAFKSLRLLCFPRETAASCVRFLAVRVERAARVENVDEILIQFENRAASRRVPSPAALGCGRADSTSPPRIRRSNSFLGGVIDSALPLCDSVRSSVARRFPSISPVL